MAEATQSLGPTWPDPTALVDLIDDLRAAGYNLDLTHYMAAQDLLLALTARGQALDSPQRLQRLLGPLLCSSPAEQAEFPHHFERWAARLPRPAMPTGDWEEELVTIDRQAKWGRRALIGIYILFSISLLQTSHPPMPRVAPILTPIATVANTPLNPVISTTVVNNMPAAPATPTPTQTGLVAPSPSLFERMAHMLWRWQTLAVVLLLLAPWLAWRLWWFYRAHLFLVRHATTETPELEKVVVQGSATALFNPLRLFRLAQELRRRVEIPAHELDIEAALSATIQRAGWFTPVYGRRRVVPEYLILIDRAHYHDHQARLVEELVQRLRAYEVLITSYAFDSDPRICFPLAGKGAPLTLRDLAAKHPDQRLLLFSDAHRLFSPFTGELEPWVAQLARWPERALLTPEVATNRSYWEQELAQYFSVLPATPAGLSQLVSSLTRPMPFTLADGLPQARLPEALRTRPLHWLERQPPEPEQMERLLSELRTYLDETGFTWLCACAVYPAIDWNLTLYLGHALQADEGISYLEPNRLLMLARLPWLRYGYMPDWLRNQLLEFLPHPQENAIRFALQTLLMTAVQGAPVGFPLDIARNHRRSLSRLARPLLSLLAWRADQDSPLQDYVFLNFMAGRKRRPLAIHLPERLFTLLSQHQASFVKLFSTFKRASHLSKNWIASLINNFLAGWLNSSLVRYAVIIILLIGFVYVTLRILAPSLNLFLFVLIFVSLFITLVALYILLNWRSQQLVSKAVDTTDIKLSTPSIQIAPQSSEESRSSTPETPRRPMVLPSIQYDKAIRSSVLDTHQSNLSLLHGRYLLRSRLGVGGMGTVYLAEDQNLAGKVVAVKQNTETLPETQTQFNQEAVLLAHLKHPALPSVTDHFIEPDGRQFLVMEYIEGKDLWEILKENGGPLPEATVLGWIVTVMDALNYLHRSLDPATKQPRPIIHRDVKPANIKLKTDGQIYLVDFGLAKVEESGRTHPSARAFTPGYSPFEQYGGGTSTRSDIYALGATLYALLTGVVPPEAPILISGDALTPPCQLNPRITPNTEQVILRAMALRPEERFQTIAEMRIVLFRKPIHTSTSTPRAVPKRRRYSVLAVPAIIVIAVIALFDALYVTDNVLERNFIRQVVDLFRPTLTSTSMQPTLISTPTPLVVAVAPSVTPTTDDLTSINQTATAVSATAIKDATATASIKTIEAVLSATSTLKPTSTPDLDATATAQAAQVQTAVEATLTAQPTATSTRTPRPTLTPKSPPTATPVPTITPQALPPPTDTPLAPLTATQASQSSRVTVNANLRAGPGSTFPVIGGTQSDQEITIVARNEDASWFLLDNGGWVAAFLVANPPVAADVPLFAEVTTGTATPPPATNTPAVPGRPDLVSNFENFGVWQRGNESWGTLTQSTENKTSGAAAAKLVYDFTPAQAANDFVVFVRKPSLPIPGQPKGLTLQVYGDGSSNFLNVWVQDSIGQIWQFTFGRISHTGWQMMSAPLDSNLGWPNSLVQNNQSAALSYPLSLYALMLDGEPRQGMQGTLFFDDLLTTDTPAQPNLSGSAAPPTPAPAAPAAPPPELIPDESCGADPTSIMAGQTALVYWKFTGIKEIYFEGQGVLGIDSKLVKPTQTTTYTVRVIRSDSSETACSITVQVN